MEGTRAQVGPELAKRRWLSGLAAAFVCGMLYGLGTAVLSLGLPFGGSSPAMSGSFVFALLTLLGMILLLPFGVVAWSRSRSLRFTGAAAALVVLGFVTAVAPAATLTSAGRDTNNPPGFASIERKDSGASVWSGPVTCDFVESLEYAADQGPDTAVLHRQVISIEGLDAPLHGGDALDAEIAARGIDDPDGLLDQVRLVEISIGPPPFVLIGPPPPDVGIIDANQPPDRSRYGFEAHPIDIDDDGWVGRIGFDRLDPAVFITWDCEPDP